MIQAWLELNISTVTDREYSIVIVVLALGLPILLTWIGYLPFIPAVLDKLKPYLVWPSIMGKYQVQPLPYLLGNAPTCGQGIYIALFVIINVVLCAVNYEPRQPSAWYSSLWGEVMAYIFYRFGAYAPALLPVVVLFSSRNNILLWLTNWSHSTYLLLHRWIARMFTLYAILHSIMGLMIYASEANTVWWIWGAVATITSVILMIGSGLYVRRAQYEIFLISHILLAIFTIVGCWYHIIGWYNSMGLNWPEHNAGGYEIWIYFTCALWFSDRLLRIIRMLRFGTRRAEVTELGSEYVRVDIAGIRLDQEPGKHIYAYFPTLNLLRPWENHPFSIIPTSLLDPMIETTNSINNGSAHGSGLEDPEAEKRDRTVTSRIMSIPTRSSLSPVGITLFIKKSAGVTKHFRSHDSLLTLLDGPYPNNETRGILSCDRLLIIGGGIGITGILP
jgi:hypothetical protein